MHLQFALERREKVERFLRKHRIGLLTLVFTDMVGSTHLKQDLGDLEAVALMQEHHSLLRQFLSRFPEAEEINTSGDSFFLAFAKPSEAVNFSLLWQARIRQWAVELGRPLSDRIGIHVGEVLISEEEGSAKPRDLYGMQVDTCARVLSLAGADQILLTRSAFDNARQILKGQDLEGLGPLAWLNHGPYLLSGVEDPVEICEAGEVSHALLKAPPDSEKARRQVTVEGEPVLGWRPALGQLVPNTRWVLEKKLGEGGFGEVWLGRHQTLREQRVFKFCFRADRIRSLRREVTLFRVLKDRIGAHPNIVGVQEVSFDQPPFYIVMDYAPATDLKAWCEMHKGVHAVSLTTRLEIVAQVAEALQAAHSAGVIHRDVKPTNILVTDTGRGTADVTVRLTDFGVGQVVSEAALAGVTRQGFTETIFAPGSTSLAGTHLYTAPELLVGRKASAQSDIYSLGAVLYQLLAGGWDQPVTTDWDKAIGDQFLRAILHRCFAGDPGARFRTAHDLAASLRAVEKQWRLQKRFRGAVTAGVAGLVGLILLLTPLGDPIERMSFDLPFVLRRATVPQEVVLVYMDPQSYQQFGQPANARWDRSIHARLLERLKADQAKACAFDIIFTDRGPNQAADLAFADAIRSFGKVILAASWEVNQEGYSRLLTPTEQFHTAAAGLGSVNVLLDSDGIVRRMPTMPAGVPSLASAAAELVRQSGSHQNGTAGSAGWLNYYGPPGTLPSVSYAIALATNGLPAGFFRDKTVFVGVKLGPAYEFAANSFPTPFGTSGMALAPGVEIQATEFLNLVRGESLTRLPLMLEAAALILLGGALGLGLNWSRDWTGLAAVTLFSLMVTAIAGMLWHSQLLWFAWLILPIQGVCALIWHLFTVRFGRVCLERRSDGYLVGYVFNFRAGFRSSVNRTSR